MTEKKKGLVMETSPEGFVTVLTPQGEFLNIPWSDKAFPEAGSEVKFVSPIIKKSFFRRGRFIALAASFILFLLIMPFWSGMILPGPEQVVAYVSVDINPSIELGINYKGKVVEATGLNDDGIKILQNLNLANLQVKKAVELITSEAVKENYLALDKENAVLITVSSEKKVPDNAKNLEQQVQKVLQKENITAKTDTIEAPLEIRTQARVKNLSSGKYIVLMEAVEQGLDLSVEDIQGNSIVKAVKNAGGVPGQLISKAQKDKKKMKELQTRFEEKLEKKNYEQESNMTQTGKQEVDNKDDETGKKDSNRDSQWGNNRKNSPSNRTSSEKQAEQDLEKDYDEIDNDDSNGNGNVRGGPEEKKDQDESPKSNNDNKNGNKKRKR